VAFVVAVSAAKAKVDLLLVWAAVESRSGLCLFRVSSSALKADLRGVFSAAKSGLRAIAVPQPPSPYYLAFFYRLQPFSVLPGVVLYTPLAGRMLRVGGRGK
jgi:hypothetical protein